MNLPVELPRWDELCTDHPGPIVDSAQISHGKGPELVVTFLIHGNEIGNLAPVCQLFDDLLARRIRFPGTLTAVLGNRAALFQNKRYLEFDLNRLFAWHGPPCPELHRANEIKKCIESADLYID